MKVIKAINDLSRHVEPIASEIEIAISRVVTSGWFVLGPEVDAFEKEFSSYCGADYCVSLANGTDALELALHALNIKEGSKVLTVANAGMYSTIAILATGATPIYADIQKNNLLIDVADAEYIILNHNIDAIIVTHLYGLLADVERIVHIAKSKNIPVIEDCAQAHGAMQNGKKAGTFGDIGCFSFYPTKNLGALGDGGAVITNHGDLATRVRQLRQYGWDSKYHATLPAGKNSRLDEIQATVLRLFLPLLDGWNASRRNIAAQYSRAIKPEIITQDIHGDEYVAHLYIIKTPDRNGLKQHLAKNGIPTDIHYPIPDYRQPAYAYLFPNITKAVTEQACEQVLTLPCFPEMTEAEVQMVINSVNNWQS
jgi:dTDP-4-amino-4,6-dideoxygalactose transaminase